MANPTPTFRDAEQPAIPGLSVRRPLQPSGEGTAWVCVEMTTGAMVVVRPARGALTGTDLPRHPHVLVADPISDVTGVMWIRAAYAEYGGLDRLLDGRLLLPGEVVTVGVAVGRALAVLHHRGLSHGAVASASVLVDATGRPLLDATAVRPGAATAKEVARDLSALGQLLLALAHKPLPERLDALLREVARADQGEISMGAADLVRELIVASPPRPLDLPSRSGANTSPRARGARWRRSVPPVARRFALTGLVGAVALTLAVALGLWWAYLAEPSSDGAAHPQTAAAQAARGPADPPVFAADGQWSGILTGLDQARADAFERADPAALSTVDAPGSVALVRDGAALAALINQGLRPVGQAFRVLDIHVLRSLDRRVLLSVTDRASAYRLLHVDGRLAVARPARGPTRWTVELAWSAGRWLFADVARVT